MMKSALTGLVAFFSSPAFAQDVAPPETCDYGEMSASAPAETGQFAFLIGDYTIHLHAWMGESWSPPQPGVTARWNGRWGAWRPRRYR